MRRHAPTSSALLPAQPCGGAIPICMVEEFDIPLEIIDRCGHPWRSRNMVAARRAPDPA